MGNFKTGDALNDDFINNLSSKKLKEEAHQLNRRTEFKVLRTNYVKGQSSIDNINLETPQSNIIDSTNAAPTAKEDVSTAIKVGVKEAPHSDTTTVRDNAAIAAHEGPGEIYTVKKGDTYNSIAKNNDMTLKDLKTLNGLKGELIYPGMELKVTMNGDYTDYDKKFHVLEKGEDSWSSIAKKLNMKSSDLKKLNKGMDDNTLRPGKRVRITQ